MSVLIRGMQMPKNCDECRIMKYEDTNCISVHELFCGCPIVFKAHPQHEEHRPDYCPLIEVEPHGRLIDADALTQRFFQVPYVCNALSFAPTIIEAETCNNSDNTCNKAEDDAVNARIESEGEDGNIM